MIILTLLIELFDEFFYGAQNSLWPIIRGDFRLDYAQVGFLLGVPAILASMVEPILMLLGDTQLRKPIILSGGVLICTSLVLVSISHSFTILALAFVLLYPASGAFVSLSQANMMDQNKGKEQLAMARWTVFGSLGNILGPLCVSIWLAFNLGWRSLYLLFASIPIVLILSSWLFKNSNPKSHPADLSGLSKELRQLLPGLITAIRKGSLLRWFGLLQFSDLLTDILTGYLALYFADIAGFNPISIGGIISAWMIVGFIADLLLIPLLKKFSGRSIVRIAALFCIPFFSLWLLVPSPKVKVLLILLVRFATMGWYQVLLGEAFAEHQGRSGTVLALNAVFGFVGGGLTWAIGWLAGQVGLQNAMWAFLAGPIILLLGTPKPVRKSKRSKPT